MDCRAYIPTKGFLLGLYWDRIIYRRGYFQREFACAKCIAYDVKSIILGQALGFLRKSLQKERALRTENQKMIHIKYSEASETACSIINILIIKVHIPRTGPWAYIRGELLNGGTFASVIEEDYFPGVLFSRDGFISTFYDNCN